MMPEQYILHKGEINKPILFIPDVQFGSLQKWIHGLIIRE